METKSEGDTAKSKLVKLLDNLMVNDYDIVEENLTRNASTILDTVVTRIRTMKQELKNLGNPINKSRRLACKECVTDTGKKGSQDKHNIRIIPGFIIWSVRSKSVNTDLMH